MRSKTLPTAGFAFALLLVSAPLFAQQAAVTGVVTDETKAILPGATITATNLATGGSQIVVTDERGEYRLLNLPPGHYKLQAELSGFSTVQVSDVELLVGQNATMPFALKVANLSETVTVSSESPLVDVTSSQVAGNVNPRQMEELPLQGRNWLELSKLVKGMTANEVTNGPGVADDMFQLNLDGQQVTQKISGGFGQPKFSRESIGEFQIVTNMFDITQGRSAGVQVQAVSRAGTNRTQGSFYSYFRDSNLNAPDFLTGTVLPYENQQIGGALGGPILKDKLHYFGSYEYEREPGTTFSAPAALPGQTFTVPYKNSQQSLLLRLDDQLSSSDRLTVRGSRWNWSNPFVLASGGHPSNASVQTKQATNILGTWSNVLSNTKVQELRIGYNNFQWANQGLPEVGATFQYSFPGLTLGKPYNYPQWLYQNNFESRYDLSWHKDTHDFKIGGEFIYAHITALWYLQEQGILTFTSVPADITSRIPVSSPYDVSTWNLNGLDPIAQKFEKNYNAGDWTLDVPGPTWGVWMGDTWRLSSTWTINYGVRWDDNWNVASTPGVITNSIPIDNGSAAATTRIPEMAAGDFGYKKGMRDNLDIAPRAGFTWNVGGGNDLVIRGGSGLYFTYLQTQYTYSPQLYSRMITASFNNDGKPGFVDDPARGVTTYDQAAAAAPPQAARIITPNFRNPYTWQSSIGFQKQINADTAVEADLVHYNEYRDTRSIDPNLFYDPSTGYNKNPAAGRPNPQWGQILYLVSTGRQDYTAIASGLTRRMKHHLQGGVTYTLMLAQHDDGTPGLVSPSANNQFNYLDGEYATSTTFQRSTLRAWSVYQMPWGLSAALSYAYGSGNLYNATIATTPYGKTGSNRLNLTATGAPTAAITIPAGVLDRWDGPAVIASGAVIPRNALHGLPYSKFDLRLTKDIRIGSSWKASLIGEVYNLFNHANYIGYVTQLSATSAATTARFGLPSAASISRQGQLAFRIQWQ
jgi:Carboxypeptidase regulatory-like domain